jgi:hypothetical protein
MASSEQNWTAFMLISSLSSFFLGWFIIGFHGLDTVGAEEQGPMVGFLVLLVIALALSWLAFVYALRTFRYYDDKRWAWFYAMASDLIATLITVAALYSVFSILSSAM